MKKLLLSCCLLLMIIGSAVAQQVRVAGRVTSAGSGNAAEGISVLVKGAKAGTATSAAGEYSILVDKSAILVFSGIGFATQEIKVNGSTLDVLLQITVGDMGEVGLNGPQFHAEAGAYARTIGIEALFTLGELSKVACEAFGTFGGGVHWQSMDALKKGVLDALPEYRSVLVKGSRFMKMETVVEAVMAVAQDSQITQEFAASASVRTPVEAPCS